jgi:hypothetical protein
MASFSSSTSCDFGEELVFLFLFFFSASSLAVFAASTLAVAFELDCFAVVALVQRPGFAALDASGHLIKSSSAS